MPSCTALCQLTVQWRRDLEDDKQGNSQLGLLHSDLVWWRTVKLLNLYLQWLDLWSQCWFDLSVLWISVKSGEKSLSCLCLLCWVNQISTFLTSSHGQYWDVNNYRTLFSTDSVLCLTSLSSIFCLFPDHLKPEVSSLTLFLHFAFLAASASALSQRLLFPWYVTVAECHSTSNFLLVVVEDADFRFCCCLKPQPPGNGGCRAGEVIPSIGSPGCCWSPDGHQALSPHMNFTFSQVSTGWDKWHSGELGESWHLSPELCLGTCFY